MKETQFKEKRHTKNIFKIHFKACSLYVKSLLKYIFKKCSLKNLNTTTFTNKNI